MKIKVEKQYSLIWEEADNCERLPGEAITVEHLGSGFFHKAFRDPAAGKVYIVQKSVRGDYSYDKEVLARTRRSIPDNPHLPDIERVGDIGNAQVFRMPEYTRITKKKYPAVYSKLQRLKDARNVALYNTKGKYDWRTDTLIMHGDQFNRNVCREYTNTKGYSESILEALEELAVQATNYGTSMIFDGFTKGNVAMNETTQQLVLLDPLFDVSLIRRRK